ncbi:MAG: hypothetical protein HC887_10805, partial [Desulfobacteraceae bacterium]|nr:hypothetical protein [Desulfobacteraceae bacterium]
MCLSSDTHYRIVFRGTRYPRTIGDSRAVLHHRHCAHKLASGSGGCPDRRTDGRHASEPDSHLCCGISPDHICRQPFRVLGTEASFGTDSVCRKILYRLVRKSVHGIDDGYYCRTVHRTFVLGLLTWVAGMASPWLGFIVFFTLSLGLGLPLFFLAVFSGNIEKLPRSGEWMLWVRKVMGCVLLLMADSTNADQPGWTPSESVVNNAFDGVFRQARGRIMVATFA